MKKVAVAVLAALTLGACGQPVGEIGGIATDSRNRQFPPQRDVDNITCSQGDFGAPGAEVSITNRSPQSSNYWVHVEWTDTTEARIAEATVRANAVDPNQQVRITAASWPTQQTVTQCRITEINRLGN